LSSASRKAWWLQPGRERGKQGEGMYERTVKLAQAKVQKPTWQKSKGET